MTVLVLKDTIVFPSIRAVVFLCDVGLIEFSFVESDKCVR